MAFRLTKKESNQRSELVAELEIESGKLGNAVTEYNEAVKAAHEALADKIAAYNEKVQEAKEFAEGIVERCQEEWDNKSEGWQEGERGSEAQSFINEWEGFSPEEIEIEEPEELELDPSERDDLENLPEEMG